MEEGPKKLVTWKQWAIALVAIFFGATMSLYREYNATGAVQLSSIALSGATIVVGFAIVFAVFQYANARRKSE